MGSKKGYTSQEVGDIFDYAYALSWRIAELTAKIDGEERQGVREPLIRCYNNLKQDYEKSIPEDVRKHIKNAPFIRIF